jgi:prepilin-type N-terminal cleavage/methylation domain-containing protein
MEAPVLTQRQDRRNGERGFSLVEMLVASAVFAIVAAVVFIFYTAAQRSYKSGENFSEQQQSTRVAFDRMISDIRLAGFNTNPDGDAGRVDEQIEGAWDTAVTIRGDFDFEDPAANASPESSLPGTVYNVVSTGNDEIVTYVLAKPGPVGADTLTIRVDANRPRTKAVQTVTIPNVVLVQDNPPYTLYRVTMKDVNGAFPSSPQAATNFTYEPVADNIRTMTFQYLPDSSATLLNPNTPANSADDIGGSDAAALTRSKIRKIKVSLVGMTPDEDLDYVDAGDATATTHYRKFDLSSDVNPENLGRTGVKDVDVTPPPSPTNIALVPGHCKGLLVKWDTPPPASGVTAYGIKYWPNGTPNPFTTASVTYPHSEFGVVDFDGHGFVAGMNNGTSYCVQVQARDIMGNQSGWAPGTPVCATASEASTPDTPQNLKATGNGTLAPQDSRIVLTWNEVQNNSNNVTNDPDLINTHTILRDGAGYKLYRDIVSTFTPNDATNLVATNTVLGNGVLTWTDAAVANCQTYYYKLKASDTCDVLGSASTGAQGQAVTNIAPSAPTGVTGARTSTGTVTITWTPVTTKVDSTTTTINQYKVYRTKQPYGTLIGSISSGVFALLGTTTTNTYVDNLLGADISDLNNRTQGLYYQITAADACGNESARSTGVDVACNIGTITVSPSDGSAASGMVPITLSIGGTGTYSSARVQIPNLSGTGTVYDQTSYSYPFTFPSFNASAAGPGDYTIHWTVTLSNGCAVDMYTRLTVPANLACQISPTNPNLSPTNGKSSNQNKNLSWDIMNNSGLNLDITSLVVSWTSNLATHKLLTIQYPTTSVVTSFGAGAVTPATGNYATFPLSLPASANGSCGTCKVNMALAYDTQIVDPNTGNGELITLKYNFQDSFANTGSCQFVVHPDLTITGP